jgi:hypothetical protein
MNPDPPPFDPFLDAIRWVEDPRHGPSRPKRMSCWLFFWRPCPHRVAVDQAAAVVGRAESQKDS